MESEDKAGLHDFTMFLGGVPVMRGDIELTRSGQPEDYALRMCGRFSDGQEPEALALPEPEAVRQADDVRGGQPEQC